MIENKADALCLVPKGMLDEIISELREIKSLCKMTTASPIGSIDENEVLDTKGAAAFLKVSTKTLKKYRDERVLVFTQTGRKILYQKSDLRAFLQEHRLGLRKF